MKICSPKIIRLKMGKNRKAHERQHSESGMQSFKTAYFDRKSKMYQTMPSAAAMKGWRENTATTIHAVKEVLRGFHASLKGLKLRKEGKSVKKTQGKVTQVGREVVDDEDPCTPNSSNAPKHVDDTLSDEDQAWLESLELADNPVKFEELPDEFSELLTRFANHDAYTV